MDLVRNTSHRDNESAKSAIPAKEIANNEKTQETQLLLRLQKMEEINAQLESLVDENRKKLNEVVATNAKFLSLVAHDLRNPFNSIIGILDLLDESFDDYSKTEIKKLIKIANNSAIRTLSLLDNLLQWSVSQNAEKSFNPVKINLRELIINEFESFNASASQKQITMDHSVDFNLHVTADLQMAKTIFRNLISNAIKYTKPSGSIFISTKEGKRFVEIEVQDDGVGISENTQKKLFKIDEFHSTLGTNNEQGTGLGLLFCKEFVGLHGGKIWTESQPGKGSKFKFTLPHYI